MHGSKKAARRSIFKSVHSADDLAFYQIESAILNGEILEEYPDIGLDESCLVLGFLKIYLSML